MTRGSANAGRLRRWLGWLWPLGLLVIAWLIAPLRAGAAYPGMPCTAQADTVFGIASYTVLFIPTAALLLLLSRRLIPAARRRNLRAWTAGLTAVGVAIAVVFLAFAGISADRRPFRSTEQSVACPHLGAGLQALHCWQSGSTIEMNAYGQRPLDVGGMQSMARALAAVKQDATLYEAFVLDTADPAVAGYSNARLFILTRPTLTDFTDVCLAEHQTKLQEVQSHRVGFYRYSARQSPPVDAFFLQDKSRAGDPGYEVIDFLHDQVMLAYVRPTDLQPDESAYLDLVASSMATLNQDLDRETQSPSPPGALATMRQDFLRITTNLALKTPDRLQKYRDGRVQRFLQNYDLILTAEESAAQGQSSQAIHSTAYEDHRRYYYQEPRVARLIGYLYLQNPGAQYSDDLLSTVNWAVF
ncbi:MAG TPA: hypothetical protein VFR68_06775 [Candidatus Dormibacteraeota bacterium]|nr:hypothetical protein [Candidatus Dormibacteraeota bacterium]